MLVPGLISLATTLMDMVEITRKAPGDHAAEVAACSASLEAVRAASAGES